MNRRLTDARLRTREAEADIARAQAQTRARDRPPVRHDGRRAHGWFLESLIAVRVPVRRRVAAAISAAPPPTAKPATVTRPSRKRSSRR